MSCILRAVANGAERFVSRDMLSSTECCNVVLEGRVHEPSTNPSTANIALLSGLYQRGSARTEPLLILLVSFLLSDKMAWIGFHSPQGNRCKDSACRGPMTVSENDYSVCWRGHERFWKITLARTWPGVLTSTWCLSCLEADDLSRLDER
jgi:hypothetical protein